MITAALGQKFCENSKTSVCLTYFDGSSYVKKPKARPKKRSSRKQFAESSDTNVRNTINKICKTCCDNVRKSSESAGTKSASSTDTLPADTCVRMVGGRVREILDLLARSDSDMGCADAYRLQKLLKSVIRALDDLRGHCCCRPRQITPSRNSRVNDNTRRLSGAGGGSEKQPLPSEVEQCRRRPHNVCNQCAGSAVANLDKLIKATTNFGCLYRYAINWDTTQTL